MGIMVKIYNSRCFWSLEFMVNYMLEMPQAYVETYVSRPLWSLMFTVHCMLEFGRAYIPFCYRLCF